MYFLHNNKVLKSQTAQLWIFLFCSCRLSGDGYISIGETRRCLCEVNRQLCLDWIYCTFKCTEDTNGINYLKTKYSSCGRFRLRLCDFEKGVKSVLLSRESTTKENEKKKRKKLLFPRVSILVELVPELYFLCRISKLVRLTGKKYMFHFVYNFYSKHCCLKYICNLRPVSAYRRMWVFINILRI
jgi:hypothetical protein